jgi:large subunit ribosomal protein L24
MTRLKKGDTVTVLSGRDRGKRGKILKMFPDREAALVERINLVKHFERRTQANQPGGIIEREAPFPLAKLALVCARCGKPARIGVRVSEDTKHRICKRCEEAIGG